MVYAYLKRQLKYRNLRIVPVEFVRSTLKISVLCRMLELLLAKLYMYVCIYVYMYIYKLFLFKIYIQAVDVNQHLFCSVAIFNSTHGCICFYYCQLDNQFLPFPSSVIIMNHNQQSITVISNVVYSYFNFQPPKPP